MEREIVKQIQKLCDETKARMNITDTVIRDDVFEVLQASDCTVLYYPLPGEAEAGDKGCAGCHVERLVNGKIEPFVFINTSNTRERQAFSAAHELGHILRIDQKVFNELPKYKDIVSEEEIVNRFAAELLMPEQVFLALLDEQLKEINYNGKFVAEKQLVEISAYMMNYFFVPYKSVVKRYNEIGRLQEKYLDQLYRYNESEYLREIIKAKQYTRLLIVNEEKSMDNLQEILLKADKKNVLNGNLAARLREEFDLKNIEEGEDSTVAF